MKIESPAFTNNSHIPEPYTRFGKNQRPPLVFRDVPPNTKSLALIVDDPDAPKGTFTHWIIFNLPPTTNRLEEGMPPAEGREGNNDWDEPGYGGPRPPDGEHRYFFKLYALDRQLDLPGGVRRAGVDATLRGHVIATAELIGRFATPVQAERDAR